jgi:hypothetical protein
MFKGGFMNICRSTNVLTKFAMLVTTAIAFTSINSSAQVFDGREAAFHELSFMQSVLKMGYAPTQWKKEQFGFNIDNTFSEVLAGLSTKSELTSQDFRGAARQLMGSTRDYHVGVGFYATEAAQLPLLVMSANSKYLIAHIQREKLSDPSLQVGDEIISWNGRPIAEVVAEVLAATQWSVPTTDARLSERYLTNRFASLGMIVPQGKVDLELKRDGRTFSYQLTWDYTPESIQWGPLTNVIKRRPAASVLRNPQMSWSVWGNMDGESQNNLATSFRIGARTSYVPTLGPIVWRSEESNPFDAYIYRMGSKLVGYVRIPHYSQGTSQFEAFKAIIARMQTATDALVIDQVSNPGGSVFFVYALMSVLSEQPIRVPAHHVALWPEMVSEIVALENEMKDVKTDADAVKVIGEAKIAGYPVSYQLVRGFLDYVRQVKAAWRGKPVVTEPVFLWGVDKINPDPQVRYTKPITVLINELDFSGGDFFPAILQDNKRAKTFGVRTSGAGGYVIGVQAPSALGLAYFSFTGSLARRVNGQPIENLGVTPDIENEITERDIKEGFVDYKKALNKVVLDSIGN